MWDRNNLPLVYPVLKLVELRIDLQGGVRKVDLIVKLARQLHDEVVKHLHQYPPLDPPLDPPLGGEGGVELIACLKG
jgi:hypothetical protein